MREMLFRGKRIDNGQWVYGSLLNLDKSGYSFITPVFDKASTIPVGKIIDFTSSLVDLETVGQYTGLTDKNGTKIFEGDILPIWEQGEEYPYKVIYNADCFMLAMLDSEQGGYPLSVKHKQTEIIGNIYDNPELLEVDHDKC